MIIDIIPDNSLNYDMSYNNTSSCNKNSINNSDNTNTTYHINNIDNKNCSSTKSSSEKIDIDTYISVDYIDYDYESEYSNE